jgi:hypothetical protein
MSFAFLTRQFEKRIDENPGLSALLFGCLASVLFYPFFLGKFVLGGTDILYAHYPNILYGYREFWQFGTFSLWNRYIFAGTDFTASMHAHFLNPFYWPLALFPEKYIFHALTAGFIVINALTGWVWSRIATQLGVLGAGSLIVGIVAQAGMFFWFAMTTLIAVPMLFCATLAIYLIVTRESRSALTNYVMLSTDLGLLFVTPHPAYILGFSLPVVVLFFIRTFPDWLYRPWREFTPIFAAAIITAVLLASYRLVPVAIAIAREGTFADQIWLPSYLNNAYLGLTAFNPFALSIHIDEAIQITKMLGVGAVRHTQAHNALYFGIAPLVLVYIAIRCDGSATTLFLAATYLTAQLTYLYAFQPLSDIINLVFYPIIHDTGVYRPATNFAFLFLLIQSIKIFQCVDKQTAHKAIRECIVIAGFVIVSGIALCSRVLHELPEFVSRHGNFSLVVNSFRVGILVIIITAGILYQYFTNAVSPLRFGLSGVLGGTLVVVAAIIAAVSFGQISGAEMMTVAFKNELALVLGCIAIVLSVGLERSKRRYWSVLVCGIAGAVFFLLPIPFAPVGRGIASFIWGALLGWGAFIALLAGTITILGRYVKREISVGSTMNLILLLTLMDLIVAFGIYSYVNVPSSPFIRKLADIYPTGILRKGSLVEESALGNLLINSQLHLNSGHLTNWSFGGRNMALCASPNSKFVMGQGNAIYLCYPRNDAEGNLYQDVILRETVQRVAMGVWIRADPGMDVRLFLTSPSHKVEGRLSKHSGDGMWHWVEAVLVATTPFKVVRPHINLAQSGRVEIYAPRLTPGVVARPALRPSDGHVVVEPKDEFPREIDLRSYRVNRVHIITGYAEHELMTNYAIVAGTPTYAGVDSDLPRDFVTFLTSFRSADPTWFNRGGLYSVLDSARLLDLLGVGYDIGAEGRAIYRPNAIPRFAAFRGYEVQENLAVVLKRLNAPDFDPTRSLLLQSEPAISSNSAPFNRLAYETTGADSLSLKITSEMPRLIMFNDRFSPHWRAYWNGTPLRIIRANGIFMAVVIPTGAGNLNFVFYPELFLILAKFSIATAALLLLLGIAAAYWSRFGHVRQVLHAS